MVKGSSVSPDAVVLSAEEAAELRQLCDALIRAARAADGWR